jgi:ABC-type antimicrobial peptide transport system permease subunit
MVMRQGVVMAVCGLAIGLGAAAATVRYLSTFLVGIEPLDVRTFAIVGAALFVVAAAACLVPARRAARLDALDALRR